ncbi:MAG: carboxypeptidase-like regulatory domain-containing protein [Desulfobacterales bacterium]|nr:carboxypeptidase-like regulatory domain-containing protein [Desulfobacterales bacterium]
MKDGRRAELRSASSGANGRFVLESAPTGTFLLRVELPPYAPWEGGVALEDGRHLDKTVRLEMNPVRSEITVTAEPGQAVEVGDSPVQVNITGQSPDRRTDEDHANRSARRRGGRG